MQFTSVAYLAFLGLVTAVYFALPGVRSRTVWLVGASFGFYYSMSSRWTLALLAVIAIGYVTGLVADRLPQDGRGRRHVASTGVALVIGVLAVFKYTGFAASIANSGLELLGSTAALPVLKLALPVGISFWTFQTIAYLVDIARAKQPAEPDIMRYALFVSFFPQVTAGPIGRANHLLPQLAEKHRFSYERMNSALLLLAWGFFKKLIVADPLGVLVQAVYQDPHKFTGQRSGLVLGIASVAFAIQIYCDFSGYTDIVRGSARLFGVDLVPNFDRPYFARSVKEFWRRWHMSLMNWLKEYVYFPLGGSRVPKWRRYFNILAVFFVSGIWHGAGFSFIVWGLLNGAYQVVGELTAKLRSRALAAARVNPDGRLWGLAQTAITFVLITIAWVFFRAESLTDALYILPRMFLPTFHVLTDGQLFKLGLGREQMLVTLIGILVVFAVDYASTRVKLLPVVARQPLPVRWAGYLAMIFVLVVFGYYGPTYDVGGFAYFKF